MLNGQHSATEVAGSPPERRGNGFAVTALVLGIIGVVLGLIPFLFFLAWVLGVLALVFGVLGRGRAARELITGRTMATWGVVLGIVAFALGIVGLVISEAAFDEIGQPDEGSPARLKIGQAAKLGGEYQDLGNGGDLAVDLKVTLLDLDNGVNPNAPDADVLFPAREERGKRWVRLRFKVANTGRDVVDSIDPTVELLDSEGEQHQADPNEPFVPALSRSDFQPGDEQVGFVGVLVPKKAKLQKAQLEVLGEEAEWQVR